MSGKLRWEDPRCGREGFDGRAGYEWENGPIFDGGGSGWKPDVPWRDFKPGSLLLWDNRQWAVTSFGLEVYSSLAQRRSDFSIRTEELLRQRGPVYMWPWDAAKETWIDFLAFEEAFRRAIEEHGLSAVSTMLDMTFRRARGMRRRSVTVARREPRAHTDGIATYLTLAG